MVTVRKLLELLQNEDPDRVVILSCDPEGNGFTPFHETSVGGYKADGTGHGEIGIEKLTEDLEKQGYSEEDVRGGQPALILWPM